MEEHALLNDKSRRTRPRKIFVNRTSVGALALVLYLGLSLIYFGKSGHYAHKYFGNGGDPIVYIWFLNWWPWAIAHGLNPFISHYVWYPDGFNMTWANSVSSAALLVSPITWLTNSVVSFNVLTLSAPALSAWVGFLLLRYLTKDTAAALIGGYLFGFSSYELAALLGHLSLDLTFVVPLCVWLVILRVRNDLSRWRFVIALAVALLVQLGFSTEILATTCVLGAVAWAIFLAFAESEVRRQLYKVAGEIVIAGVIMCVLAAPFLFYVVKDLHAVPQINSPEIFSADLLNYFVPTEVTRFGSSAFRDVAKLFQGNSSEQGAYLGLPLILILVLQFANSGRRRYLKAIFVTLLVMAVFSLGPRLHIAGVTTGVWLPWGLAGYLPVIHQALPTRFSVYVALTAAVAAGLWLAAAKSTRDRAMRFTLAGLACLCLVPSRGVFRWTPLPLQPFFEPHHVVATLGRGANVIVLPFGYNGPGMLWQWQSKMSFTQAGGYVSYTPPSELLNPAVVSLYGGTPSPNFKNGISAFCINHHVSAILVGPGTPSALAAAVEALHWPATSERGIRVVRVPDLRAQPYFTVSGDYWPSGGWMGKQINIVTHRQPVQLRITAPPPWLAAVDISVANGSEISQYHIAQGGTQTVPIAADASVIVRASDTFVPDRLLHNGDQRQLSVLIDLRQE